MWDETSLPLGAHGTLTVQGAADAGWPGAPDICQRAMDATWPHIKALKTAAVPWEVTLRLCDADTGRAANLAYRGKDYATNVLSFVADADSTENGVRYAGDILVCAPVVQAEAHQLGKPADEHLAHLAIHGLLHLHGFDHVDEAEAVAMERLETRIMINLGFNNPYADDETLKELMR